jgi:hypothetical protein
VIYGVVKIRLSAVDRVVHHNRRLWVLQVVSSNPVAPTIDFKYLSGVLAGGREPESAIAASHVVSRRAVARPDGSLGLAPTARLSFPGAMRRGRAVDGLEFEAHRRT